MNNSRQVSVNNAMHFLHETLRYQLQPLQSLPSLRTSTLLHTGYNSQKAFIHSYIASTAAYIIRRVFSTHTLFNPRPLSRKSLTIMADFTMEDTQNSAPGQPSIHEAWKLSSTSRRQDTQSVTKRCGRGMP